MFRKCAGLILFLILLGTTPCFADGSNLIKNGSFEDLNGDQPSSWLQDMWSSEATNFSVVQEDAHTGQHAAYIESYQANDARYVQKVAVKPDTTYKLSAYVKVIGGEPNQKGANVSIIGVNDTSVDFKDTAGAWQQVVLYGTTADNQDELEVAVRLGGYGSTTTGKAYFDDVALEKIDAVPAGAQVISFATAAPENPDNLPDYVSAMGIAGYALIFYVFFIYVYQRWFRRNQEGLQPNKRLDFTLLVIMGAALFIRLYIAGTSPGYANDISSFKAWAEKAAAHFSGFYEGGADWFADYPPGYLYVLFIIGKLASWFHLSWAGKGALILVKLPAILADLGIAWLLYRLGAKRLGSSAGFGMALLILFNPAFIVDSAAWGQVDSFFTLFILASFLLLTSNRWEWAAVLFALAVLIKPQALIFTPAILYPVFQQWNWRRFLTSVGYAAGTFLLLILPFSIHKGNLRWIIDLYQSTLSQYNYTTLNAFNLYTLLGMNFQSADTKLIFMSVQTWGNLFIVAAVFLTALLYFSKRTVHPAKTIYTALLLIVMVFMLAAKMHERYMFPALGLLLIAYLFSKDKRFLHLFAAFSITQYLNMHHVLHYVYQGQSAIPKLDNMLLAVSLVNLLLFIWLVKIGYDLWVRDRTIPLEPAKTVTALPTDPSAVPGLLHPVGGADMSRFTRKDWLWMGGLTLAYAIVALVHLGSHHSPETSWKPAYNGSVVIDLGSVHSLERVNSFDGIGEGKFQLDFAETPDNWGNPVTIENTYTTVFYWNVQNLNVSARYVRLTSISSGFTLNELAFYEKDSDTPVPVLSVNEDETKPPVKGTANNLFDEQKWAVKKPTFMDKTYFDEIYHARTAFEHIHLMKPYENTHPPLGKLFIALGIKVFGMNPFGWRISGTLVGIFMVPLMYLFGKRLFHRSEWALLASFLMAVDFMHFAQTRIATIDSYGVFFIIIMFYFMYRYYSLSFYDVPLRKTLVPLFLSGLFFGIGAASKWIALYGGAGLALIFFLSLFERYRQWSTAGQLLAMPETANQPERRSRYEHIRKTFFPSTAKTVGWASLFFVIIPTMIYSLTFLPYMMVKGEPKTVHQLVQYQKDMWDYHSKLKATHGFSSTWYEWPFMTRPIWYYSSPPDLPRNEVSSISSFGNPGIWWVGLVAFIAMLWIIRKKPHRGMVVAVIAFFSQYVPWILVTRLTFIYHYFAMVPFLIFAIVYLCKYLTEKNPSWRKAVWGYAAVCLILFIMFYPVLSGMVVSKSYVSTFLRWFDSWIFFS
ncbi:glycosyltransferase family 39 protein [Gorillibacterium massiliense]|uniref:glycosyltransferase family 39 protein n=1 Tax=Gorillibacterium massiliense TaxID=1280390 RepID=UPI0004B81864|nr:glycosyltransferase family 39 protein [Gorillibacterium massiliense]